MTEKRATIKQIEGVAFAAKANSNHWVIMDGKKEFGGAEAGSTPKELLLFALGGCTANDLVSILRKKRVPFTDCEIHLSGIEAEEHPRVFTSIHIEYVLYGSGISTADVERAIELSVMKYCSVSAMLAKACTITHSYRIEETREMSPAEVISN
jgi:putative redox protein